MRRLLFYIIAFLIWAPGFYATGNTVFQASDSISDGPYIFNIRNTITAKSVENGILTTDIITRDNFAAIKSKYNLTCTFEDLRSNYLKKINYAQSFKMADSIAFISDIHGEYNSYINLLKGNGIIDKDLNWKFGKGHLVILGDIFDRGDKVTEVLWHLFGLEKQAHKAGGMVHILLGNHEIMVLAGDQDYINEKYIKVEELTETSYFNLYSKNSVLGNWLRSKPVIITINNILIVHGGISPELLARRLSPTKINELFCDRITGRMLKEEAISIELNMTAANPNGEKAITADQGFGGMISEGTTDYERNLEKEKEMEELRFLVDDFGPIWYRGYFTDRIFGEKELDPILEYYSMKHIVVGHTTSDKIITRFNKKVIGIDAGIGRGETGQMLIYKNGLFYKGTGTGARILI